MALDNEAITRIAVLRDALSVNQQAHAARVGTLSDESLFVKHADGSVYDRKGRELRGPLPKKLAGVI